MNCKEQDSILNTRICCRSFGQNVFQEVGAVDDLKLTITTRMFIYMKWTDKRIIHNRTNKNELAVMVNIEWLR